MFVFACAGCGAELTTSLSQVTLPVHAHQKYGNGIQLPVLMEPGTFAVDPEPWGPPWRRWEEIPPDEAAARGVYAPVYALSDGASGAIVIAPGDTRGTVLIPEKGGGYCCGLDGPRGPTWGAMRAACPWRAGSTTARSGRRCGSPRTPCAACPSAARTPYRCPGRS